jgi:hypothetical protein
MEWSTSPTRTADKDGDTPTSESAPKEGDVMVEDQSRGRPAADMITGNKFYFRGRGKETKGGRSN